ncbi:sialidase family protein [Algoriphagus confluentis]|uniref:Photosynthesis system II assembly factor Ycf48/Hcf136-like domain-containing protein n=1 Tax=Algoriphagus confluentis TaxID=1697556 RepID=A0ABQ6PXR5_9BACT|nr:hypothetical protein Aconfl_41820 [Algoriphagus confluentis]
MNRLNSRTILFITALLFSITGCIEDNESSPITSGPFTFVSQELNGISVNELVIKGDWIFAATTNGVYGKKLSAAGSKFLPLGLQKNDVRDIHAFTTSEMIASVVNFTSTNTEVKIFKTTNSGKNWNLFETNFGGPDENFRDGLNDFEEVPGEPNHLYAAGQLVVAKSLDKGKTWTPVWGDWGMAAQPLMTIAVNPLKPDELWAGGQGSIENGYLIKIKNDQEEESWYDLVPNPTTVKEIVIDRESPQSIYVGWEGELSKTTDNGKTWQTLIDASENSDFFFGIGLSPTVSSRIYAGRWIKGKDQQTLEIYYSDDKGITWQSNKFLQITKGGVWDLKVTRSGNKDRIFLGLDKGGVVELINESQVSTLLE